MPEESRTLFLNYLREVPDDLLDCLVPEYEWLALEFAGQGAASEFIWRMEACAAEQIRRAGARLDEGGHQPERRSTGQSIAATR